MTPRRLDRCIVPDGTCHGDAQHLLVPARERLSTCGDLPERRSQPDTRPLLQRRSQLSSPPAQDWRLLCLEASAPAEAKTDDDKSDGLEERIRSRQFPILA